METIEKNLKELKRAKKYISLSLHPPIGDSTIRKEGNRMFINEGRNGKYAGVTEAFYDDMVSKYDSRNRIK
jgi:hypothetical protein